MHEPFTTHRAFEEQKFTNKNKGSQNRILNASKLNKNPLLFKQFRIPFQGEKMSQRV